jgi:hypothetical protein
MQEEAEPWLLEEVEGLLGEELLEHSCQML